MYTFKDVSLTIDGMNFEGCPTVDLERRPDGGTIRFTCEADLTDDAMIKLLSLSGERLRIHSILFYS